MNPHYSDEMKDIALREYLQEVQNAHEDFERVLDELKTKAMDFSEGSQQRFLVALIACDRARDYCWFLEQKSKQYE